MSSANPGYRDSISDNEEERASGEEEEEEEEREESKYNNGRGLMISATFHARHPPIKPGDKRRRNAKPPVTSKVIYVHENADFFDMIMEAELSFCNLDMFDYVVYMDGIVKLARGAPFSLEYSIPYTALKDIELASGFDWMMFVEKMKDTAKASGKLTIREKADEATQMQDAAVVDEPQKKKKKMRTTDSSDIPPMSLTAFCERYGVSEQLNDKLVKLGFQGPQDLCWIKDEDLRGEGGLLLGELGVLRDAEQRWKKSSE